MKTLGGETKSIRRAVFGFEAGASNPVASAGSILWRKVQPGTEIVSGGKLRRQIRAEFH